MGLLSGLLNPLSITKDALKKTKQVFHGDVKGALTGGTDPGSQLFRSVGGSSPKMNPAAAAAAGGVDPSQYGADPNDPAYGSFTKPFDVEQFYNYADPGYAFELQQGTQSLQNAASAGSGAFSGAALKDLLGYSQNFARTGYGDAFNRYQTQQGNIFSRLSDIAKLGQNAAAGVGSQGTQLASNAGQMISNAGSASGAGIVGAGNAVGDGLTNYWLMSQFNKKPQPVATGVPGGV
jgi:hypothetical protein